MPKFLKLRVAQHLLDDKWLKVSPDDLYYYVHPDHIVSMYRRAADPGCAGYTALTLSIASSVVLQVEPTPAQILEMIEMLDQPAPF